MLIDDTPARARQGVDILLLSASNYPALPIYPYAFVQVSALAARHGLTTARLDLLGTPKEAWRTTLHAALERASPRLIGIHLRQLDSIFIWNYADYDLPGAPPVRRNSYWPFHDTAQLITILRELTDCPIMLGGFGFTTRTPDLLERLQPDFGVTGEPDEVLEHLDDVLANRDVARIANLAHRSGDGYALTPRVFLPPADHTEYTDAVLDDLLDFYGPRRVIGPDADVHVAVEIQRGCPYRCYFCTEPMVKGRRHHVRDLDAVMADITFLADRGVSRVWLVCSEINVGSNGLLFEMAARMRKLNHGRRQPVSWTCYLLPNPPLERSEIRTLLESRFEPSWNQFGSYHDENLKRTRVPYRARHAIRAQVDWLEEDQAFRRERGLPEPTRRLDMFLGNTYATPETVSATLRTVSELRLAERFDDSLITRATRVFDLGDGLIEDTSTGAYSVGPNGRLDEVDLVHPTFSYPTALVEVLGSARAVDELFAYAEKTFLSRAYRTRLDWPAFLVRHTGEEQLARWCDLLRHTPHPPGEDEAAGAVRALLAADGGRTLLGRLRRNTPGPPEGAPARENDGRLARALVELVVGTEPERTGAVLAAIGLTGYWDERAARTAYDVCAGLAARFATVEAAREAARTAAGPDDPALPLLAVEYCLYDNNVLLRPDWSRVLFDA
ncbi:B12-binding domain-containing radical SAM protein [Streptomyces luteolus]|uniref:Radical SAM protein n=1 Tax=Streptomyces luteolus TaxID=3043615 RepID=A0ABT6T656_9ACTN|nr:radical SAM protein [Streptomyces sp. B-S-A12]MDI3423362.1 radical SAM protein [Streptomyces sp. B-S-A12]